MSPRKKPRVSRRLAPIEKADLLVARTVALDKRSRAGKAVARFAELGDQPPLVMLSVSVAAVGALRRDERVARTGLRMLAAHSLTIMAKRLGKGSIDRTRPGDALRNDHYRLEEGDSNESRLQSMPSGHSAGSTAVAIAATRDYPQLAVLSAGLGGAVMLAQLPSKNHFLSDVLVGAAIGLLSALAAQKLIPPLKEIRPERAPPRPARP